MQEIIDRLVLKVKQLKKLLVNQKKMFTNQKRFMKLLMVILLNIKVMVMEMNQYQLLDILIILENIWENWWTVRKKWRMEDSINNEN